MRCGHVTVQMWTCPCHCTDMDKSSSLYRYGHFLVTVQMWTYLCHCTDMDIFLSLTHTHVHTLTFHSFHSFPTVAEPYTLHFPHLIDLFISDSMEFKEIQLHWGFLQTSKMLSLVIPTQCLGYSTHCIRSGSIHVIYTGFLAITGYHLSFVLWIAIFSLCNSREFPTRHVINVIPK